MGKMSNFKGQFNLNKSGFDPNMPGHSGDHFMILRQQPRTAKDIGAGIGLPKEVRHEMALMLDDNQCALTVALHQYNKHHWLTEGAESFLSLHHLLEEHIVKTQKHIDMIWERVVRLGVAPTAHPVTQHELSYIKHEVEGRYSTVQVLEEVLLDREALGYHLYSVLEDDTFCNMQQSQGIFPWLCCAISYYCPL